MILFSYCQFVACLLLVLKGLNVNKAHKEYRMTYLGYVTERTKILLSIKG